MVGTQLTFFGMTRIQVLSCFLLGRKWFGLWSHLSRGVKLLKKITTRFLNHTALVEVANENDTMISHLSRRKRRYFWWSWGCYKIDSINQIYTPENKHGTWKSPFGKGETSTNHQFWGSMFVCGGVLKIFKTVFFNTMSLLSHLSKQSKDHRTITIFLCHVLVGSQISMPLYMNYSVILGHSRTTTHNIQNCSCLQPILDVYEMFLSTWRCSNKNAKVPKVTNQDM